jgi:hypothetical protein
MNFLIQVIGWSGTILVVMAYVLVSNKKVSSTSTTYQWLNLLGATGIGINTFFLHAWPSFALQLIWGGVAIAALIKKK